MKQQALQSSTFTEASHVDSVTSSSVPPPSRTRAKNVSVLLRSEDSRVELASAFKDVPGFDFYLTLRPVSAAGPFGRRDVVPDVLLVEVDASNSDDINYIRALRAGRGLKPLPVVALSDGAKQLAAIGAIRAGADDVVLTPINRTDLVEVLDRVVQASAPESAGLGQLVAFIHVSGGVGATTLAVNSAAAIAKAGQAGRVSLLDLDVQYGNVASLLDIPRASPVEALMDEPASLDRGMFESLLINHDSGVEVLTAPRLPFPLAAYRSEMVENLIRLARQHSAVVVADLAVALAPWTDIVLREAAVIFVVCTPTVASVHRLAQFLRLMERELLGDLPFRIVLNRCQDSSAELSPKKFAEAVGRPVHYTILEDNRLVSASHDQGRPAVSIQPGGRFAQQINAMLSNELGNSVLPTSKKPWWQLGGS
jgi:pilus assembly protein CpaE